MRFLTFFFIHSHTGWVPTNIFDWNVSAKEQNTCSVTVWSIPSTEPITQLWSLNNSLNPLYYTYTKLDRRSFHLHFFFFSLFGCAGSSLLLWLFSGCVERGLLSSCGVWAAHWGGFPYCKAQTLAFTGFRSCGCRGLEHRLRGTWAELPRGMWDLSEPGLEPMSLALAHGFFTMEPLGKPTTWVS